MHQVVASGLTRTRQALLGYVARYGVTDEATCRQVAARIWRSVPRHLDAAQVIAAADERGIAMVFTGTRHFRH